MEKNQQPPWQPLDFGKELEKSLKRTHEQIQREEVAESSSNAPVCRGRK